jgi:hypothetical protein
MTCQQFGLAFGRLGELAFESFDDAGVKRAPRLAQQRAVCRILPGAASCGRRQNMVLWGPSSV